MADERVVIYTDGACSGNPGPGGYGALLRFKGVEKEVMGGEAETTNNRMEMMAALEALRALNRSCVIDLYTDSTYLKDGITKWIHGWKQKGWKTAAKKPVKNADIWQALDQEVARHDITWHWVKGHAGDPDNERVDEIARSEVERMKAYILD